MQKKSKKAIILGFPYLFFMIVTGYASLMDTDKLENLLESYTSKGDIYLFAVWLYPALFLLYVFYIISIVIRSKNLSKNEKGFYSALIIFFPPIGIPLAIYRCLVQV